jgi:hypothetical protein
MLVRLAPDYLARMVDIEGALAINGRRATAGEIALQPLGPEWDLV